MDHPQKPHMGDRALAEAAARRLREAEALRENLRRRKQQARERTADPLPASPEPGTPERG